MQRARPADLSPDTYQFFHVLELLKHNRPINTRPSDILLNQEFFSNKRLTFSRTGHEFFRQFIPFLVRFNIGGEPPGILVGGKACELLLREQVDSPDIDYELYSLPGTEGQSMYLPNGKSLTERYDMYVDTIIEELAAYLSSISQFDYEPMVESDYETDMEASRGQKSFRIINGVYYISKIVNKRYYSKVAVLAKLNGEVERIVEFKLPEEKDVPVFKQPTPNSIRIDGNLYVPNSASLIVNNIMALDYRITKLGEFSMQYDQYIKYMIEGSFKGINLLKNESFLRNQIILYKMRIFSHVDRINRLFKSDIPLQFIVQYSSLFNWYLVSLYNHSYETLVGSILPQIIASLPHFYTSLNPLVQASAIITLQLITAQNELIISDPGRYSNLDTIDKVIEEYHALVSVPIKSDAYAAVAAAAAAEPSAAAAEPSAAAAAPAARAASGAPVIVSSNIGPAIANTNDNDFFIIEDDTVPNITKEEVDNKMKEADRLIKMDPKIIVRVVEKKRDTLLVERSRYLKERRKKARQARIKEERHEQLKRNIEAKQSANINAAYNEVRAARALSIIDQYNLVLEPLVYVAESESNKYSNHLYLYYDQINFQTALYGINENLLLNMIYFMLTDYVNLLLFPPATVMPQLVKTFSWTFYYNILQPLGSIVAADTPLFDYLIALFQKVAGIKDIFMNKDNCKDIYMVLVEYYFSVIAKLSKAVLLYGINRNDHYYDEKTKELFSNFSKLTHATKSKFINDSTNLFCEVYAEYLERLIRKIKSEQQDKSLVPTIIMSTKSAIRAEHYELVFGLLQTKDLNKSVITQYPSITIFKERFTTILNFVELLYTTYQPPRGTSLLNIWNKGSFFTSFEKDNIDLHYLEIMLSNFMKVPAYEDAMNAMNLKDFSKYFDITKTIVIAKSETEKKKLSLLMGYAILQITDTPPTKQYFVGHMNFLKLIHFFHLLNQYSKERLHKFLLINHDFVKVFDVIYRCQSADVMLKLVETLVMEERVIEKSVVDHLFVKVKEAPYNSSLAPHAEIKPGVSATINISGSKSGNISKKALNLLRASGATVASAGPVAPPAKKKGGTRKIKKTQTRKKRRSKQI